MKVLIISNNDVGLYKFRKELIQQLIQNHSVSIALPYGQYVDQMVNWGCKYIDTPFDRHGKNPVNEIKLLLLYKKIIRAEKPDIVFTYTVKPNVYGGMACAALKVPYVANVTGLGSSIENGGIIQRIALILYKYGLRKAKTVFFQNSSNEKMMIEKKIIRGKHDLLPGSGVNLNDFKYAPYPDKTTPVRFTFVGRLMRDKGVFELIEAAKIIKNKHPEVQFDLIGPYDEAIQSQVEAVIETGVINYIGPQQNVVPYYQRSWAIIHPSYHEGLSNVCLEAASVGRPILASDIPGCRETLDDGVSGFLFKPHDSSEIVSAVERFLQLSYDEKETMGKLSHSKIENSFDRGIIVRKYIERLEEL